MEISKYVFVSIVLLLLSCTSDDEGIAPIQTLADLVAQNDIEIDNVIACASGSQNENEIVAYLYPRPGASDIQYFETVNTLVDKNNYTNYTPIDIPTEDLFNGYLKKFVRTTVEEKWVIITFRESGKVHLSNPIRLKHQTQNTLFGNTIAINQEDSGEPRFEWEPIVSNTDAIYFQVVSDTSNELLSGTYTFESQFQFYNLDNVVLNITDEVPAPLLVGDTYRFTLMAVSEDNWVNYLGLEIPFLAQ